MKKGSHDEAFVLCNFAPSATDSSVPKQISGPGFTESRGLDSPVFGRAMPSAQRLEGSSLMQGTQVHNHTQTYTEGVLSHV